MTEALGDVDARLEDEGAEGDAGDPGDEEDNVEDGKDQKDDAAGVVLARQHVDCRGEAEDDVQDAGDPDELLGEDARERDVDGTEDDGDNEDKGEEDNGVCVQTKAVDVVVDAVAKDALPAAVAACVVSGRSRDERRVADSLPSKSDARDGGETGKDGEEENGCPQVIPLWLCNLEGMVKVVLALLAVARLNAIVLTIVRGRLRVVLLLVGLSLGGRRVILLLWRRILRCAILLLRGRVLRRSVLIVLFIRHDVLKMHCTARWETRSGENSVM